MPRALVVVLLLTGSNIFMTFAWYYHLKARTWPLLAAIFISWGIALFEYFLQVPANRYGHQSHGGPFSAAQLKIIQEGLTLTVFAVFSLVILREKLRPQDLIAFLLIFSGVAVGMSGKAPPPIKPPPPSGNTTTAGP